MHIFDNHCVYIYKLDKVDIFCQTKHNYKKKEIMATKSKTKTRVSKSQSSTFKFQWWMAAIVILAVAIVGLVVLQFSKASGSDGGWCDQYFAQHPSEAKVVCFFAIDDLSTRDPNKVQSGVALVQNADPETSLSGAEAYYFDTAGASEGTLIWGGPSRDFNGLAGKTLKACWWLRDTSGAARVQLVMKSNGNIIAQENQTVGGAYYNPYCTSQNITTNLPNTTFELKLISGSVRANRMEASTTPTPIVAPTQTKPVIVAPLTINTVKPSADGRNAALVSQDGVSGGCNVQVGFKSNTNFRACIVESGKGLNIFSPSFTSFIDKNINVCVGTLGTAPTVQYYYHNQPVKLSGALIQTTTKAGTEGFSSLVACGKLAQAPQFEQIKITTPDKSFITSVTISQSN